MEKKTFKDKKTCDLNVLKKIPLFSTLNDEELSKLRMHIINKKFLKNEVVLLEEDTPNYLYIIYSGRVKVVKTTLDGKEQILAIHKKGDFFGEMSLLDNRTSPAAVIAMDDSYIGLLSKLIFETYFLQNEKFLRQIINILCKRLREAWLIIKVLGYSDAIDRIRALLNIVSQSYGAKDARGTLIMLRLSHRDIANYVSLSRETVTRLLDRLIEEGEIDIIDKKYILLQPKFYEKLNSI